MAFSINLYNQTWMVSHGLNLEGLAWWCWPWKGHIWKCLLERWSWTLVWKEERGCSLSEGLELGSYWRDSARFCLSRSGVRIEPGFIHTDDGWVHVQGGGGIRGKLQWDNTALRVEPSRTYLEGDERWREPSERWREVWVDIGQKDTMEAERK